MSLEMYAAPVLRILCPLYKYPEWYNSSNYRFWDNVANASSRVPITVIINPDNGPGNGPPNSDYQQGLATLRSGKNITIVGYVYTEHGRRNLEEVKADVDLYAQYFEIDGIFFDQVASGPKEFKYYKELYDYVKKSNFHVDKKVIINPGNRIYERYISSPVCDITVIFESHLTDDSIDPANSSPNTLLIEEYIKKYPNNTFAVLAHGVPDADTMKTLIDLAVTHNVGYIYITDDTLPNPWDQLPTFWETEINYIECLNAGGTFDRCQQQ